MKPDTEGRACETPGVRFSLPLNLIHRNKEPSPLSMRVPAGFSMPNGPWEEGLISGSIGLAECPYSVASRDGWAWSSGYVEGRARHAKSTG